MEITVKIFPKVVSNRCTLPLPCVVTDFDLALSVPEFFLIQLEFFMMLQRDGKFVLQIEINSGIAVPSLPGRDPAYTVSLLSSVPPRSRPLQKNLEDWVGFADHIDYAGQCPDVVPGTWWRRQE